MTNVWGLGKDEGSIDIASIKSLLNSKIDRNGDEMHGDLQMNSNNIKGLDINAENLSYSSAVPYGVFINYLTEAFSQFLQLDGSNMMRGDLLVDSTNNDNVAIGCSDFGSDQKGFALLLGNVNNSLLYNTLLAKQPVVLYTSDGFEVIRGNTDKYLSVGTNGDPRIIAHKPIRLMMGGDNDAVTKQYVDKKTFGLIPALNGSTSNRSGHVVSVSSQFNSSYSGAYCFMPHVSAGEWATLGVNGNFWIKIQCPHPIFVSKMQLRGRIQSPDETLDNWRFEGSDDDTIWDLLYSSTQSIGNQVYEFVIDTNPTTAYLYYRIFCVTASGINPGLSYIQFF